MKYKVAAVQPFGEVFSQQRQDVELSLQPGIEGAVLQLLETYKTVHLVQIAKILLLQRFDIPDRGVGDVGKVFLIAKTEDGVVVKRFFKVACIAQKGMKYPVKVALFKPFSEAFEYFEGVGSVGDHGDGGIKQVDIPFRFDDAVRSLSVHIASVYQCQKALKTAVVEIGHSSPVAAGMYVSKREGW